MAGNKKVVEFDGETYELPVSFYLNEHEEFDEDNEDRMKPTTSFKLVAKLKELSSDIVNKAWSYSDDKVFVNAKIYVTAYEEVLLIVYLDDQFHDDILIEANSLLENFEDEVVSFKPFNREYTEEDVDGKVWVACSHQSDAYSYLVI